MASNPELVNDDKDLLQRKYDEAKSFFKNSDLSKEQQENDLFERKYDEAKRFFTKPEKKWSLHIFGIDIPYWVIIVVIIIILVILHKQGKLAGIESKIVELPSSARRLLDKGFGSAKTTSTTSPLISMTSPAVGASASVVGSTGSEQVKQQLRNLFRGF
jgi:hypothetical protein